MSYGASVFGGGVGLPAASPRNAGYDFDEWFLRGLGGHRGPAEDANAQFNREVISGGYRSDRDQYLWLDTNTSVENEMLADTRRRKLFDFAQHEVIFVYTDDRHPVETTAAGITKPSMYMLGLSAFNEYLRSGEGRELYSKERDGGKAIKKKWSIAGVIQSRVENEVEWQGRPKSNSFNIWVGGRATMPDISCYSRGYAPEQAYQPYATKPGDYLSLCIRRCHDDNKFDGLAPSDQLKDDGWFWQAVPVRHVTLHPNEWNYRSGLYMLDRRDRWEGDFWLLGQVRSITHNNFVNSTRITEACYNYLFDKQANSTSHLDNFHQLPTIEIFLMLAGRQ